MSLYFLLLPTIVGDNPATGLDNHLLGDHRKKLFYFFVCFLKETNNVFFILVELSPQFLLLPTIVGDNPATGLDDSLLGNHKKNFFYFI